MPQFEVTIYEQHCKTYIVKADSIDQIKNDRRRRLEYEEISSEFYDDEITEIKPYVRDDE